MDTIKNILLDWVKVLDDYHMPVWNELPDIELYMDQVITYLERQLSIFSKSIDEKQITPSMINNYVKNEIIPRPIRKKYDREHIAYLISILNLKNILSLMEISNLISHEISDKSIDSLYNQLILVQEEALKGTAMKIKETIESLKTDETNEINEEGLCLLALKFSLEANANRIAAKKIIDELIANKANENGTKEKNKIK